MALTDAAIRAAKPRGRAYRIADELGLSLQVNPDGSRWWRFRYRFHSREKMISFGQYPGVSLKRAREKRKGARDQMDKGLDPSAERKAERIGHAITFRFVADHWLEKQRNGVTRDTHARMKLWLAAVWKKLGNRPIAEMEAPELLAVLRGIEEDGHFDTVRRVRATCERVFAHAIGEGWAARNIAAGLNGNLKPRPKNRTGFPHISDPAKVGFVLRLIDNYPGQSVTRHALQLLPLVFTRPGELRGARWSEFTFDLTDPDPNDRTPRPEPTWRIPPGRMKMAREHLVPLAHQAVSILRSLHRETGDGDLLFPSLRSSARPMSENTLNLALQSIGISRDELVPHGFRKTASTLLNEQGWNSDLIELQLAHVDGDKVRAIYNKSVRLAERRQMMQAWADHLDRLKTGGNVNVVPFRAKSA